MDRWTGRVALVTGGSAGIGAAVTRELVKCGMKVVACARNIEKIQEIKKELKDEPGELMPIQCDLCQETQIRSMFDQIRETHGRLDVLVNNAGMGVQAKLLSGSTECWREMFELNVLATCICTKEAFKLMSESTGRGDDHGHIINISSMSGQRLVHGLSDYNFYGMTKAALNFHTEGIRRELREEKSDIKISSISPGPVLTKSPSSISPGNVPKNSDGPKILETEDIVAACIYLLSSPPHVQVHDILIRPTHQVP